MIDPKTAKVLDYLIQAVEQLTIVVSAADLSPIMNAHNALVAGMIAPDPNGPVANELVYSYD